MQKLYVGLHQFIAYTTAYVIFNPSYWLSVRILYMAERGYKIVLHR